jgi:hypothetical protein
LPPIGEETRVNTVSSTRNRSLRRERYTNKSVVCFLRLTTLKNGKSDQLKNASEGTFVVLRVRVGASGKSITGINQWALRNAIDLPIRGVKLRN